MAKTDYYRRNLIVAKKKEINAAEESFSAGGAHAVNKFRISDAIMMLVIILDRKSVV